MADNTPSGELLDVYSKPKKVTVREAIPAGSLIVVPECRKVEAIAKASRDPPPKDAIEVMFSPAHPSHTFWLVPVVSQDWVVPFWALPTTSDQEKATLKVEYL